MIPELAEPRNGAAADAARVVAHDQHLVELPPHAFDPALERSAEPEKIPDPRFPRPILLGLVAARVVLRERVERGRVFDRAVRKTIARAVTDERATRESEIEREESSTANTDL